VRYFFYILIVLVIVGWVSFASLNAFDVTVDYWFGKRTFSFSLLTVLVFAGGYFLGLLIAFCLQVKVRIKNYQLLRKLKVAEEEIRNLRAIPLQVQDGN
jgi:lipopolysaccharide assembly protein A